MVVEEDCLATLRDFSKHCALLGHNLVTVSQTQIGDFRRKFLFELVAGVGFEPTTFGL
jgi:hypothetical protein